jgi:hypothetical protein
MEIAAEHSPSLAVVVAQVLFTIRYLLFTIYLEET